MKAQIGIRREDHNRWERRVPLIPSHVKELVRDCSLDISIQPSSLRIFSEEEYRSAGAKIHEDLSLCTIILGVKEMPVDNLLNNKVYVFFSHTIKGQAENMPLLKQMKQKKCTLIDYEQIVNKKGQRLVFFGTHAGKAGMIDILWAFGQRIDREYGINAFSGIRQAFKYASLAEARNELEKTGLEISQKGLNYDLFPLVCGFSGYGRVSQGAQEIFDLLPVETIEPDELLYFYEKGNYYSNKVYKVVFKEKDMVKPVNSEKTFDLQDYYENPENYASKFDSYLPYISILVNCIYWEPRYPRFVTKKPLKSLWEENTQPRLKVIGDISCDIHGAVECTVKATSPDQPTYIYDPVTEQTTDGLEGRGVAIMAVDNLPAEIPLESSQFFSQSLKPLIPEIAGADFKTDFEHLSLPPEIKKAVILYRGEFTPDYTYLEKFL
jgi:alpha-aminoadipic semialdehyde synthase